MLRTVFLNVITNLFTCVDPVLNTFTGVKYMAKVLTEKPSCFQITLCGVDWPRYIKSMSGLKKTSRMLIISAQINDSDTQSSTSESLAHAGKGRRKEDRTRHGLRCLGNK